MIKVAVIEHQHGIENAADESKRNNTPVSYGYWMERTKRMACGRHGINFRGTGNKLRTLLVG